MGRESSDQSGELCRLEEVQDPRIHGRTVCRRAGTNPGALLAAGEALPGTRARAADRDESRLALGPDHEPLRRYAARDGGKRARICADRARSRLPRLRVLDEV